MSESSSVQDAEEAVSGDGGRMALSGFSTLPGPLQMLVCLFRESHSPAVSSRFCLPYRLTLTFSVILTLPGFSTHCHELTLTPRGSSGAPDEEGIKSRLSLPLHRLITFMDVKRFYTSKLSDSSYGGNKHKKCQQYKVSDISFRIVA